MAPDPTPPSADDERHAPPEPVRRFREAYRAEFIGPRYSGPAHFAFVTLAALSGIAYALGGVRAPTPAELATVPLTFVFANLAEYGGHRHPMHRPWRGLGLVYRRHARQHHHFYTHDAMALESSRDVQMVLFPPVLLVFFALAFVLPAGTLVYLFASPNAARLFAATAVGYYLLYEWLHLAYHLPPGSFVARLSLVRALRALHTAHHDLGLMGKYNFNITFPIGDWLFGTRHRGRAASPAAAASAGARADAEAAPEGARADAARAP
ncbi:MAG TPA: sterol desaturase family protein [Polyangiaceae bacterium]|nr:sterol desaturase family protein [Polyangiaceae bacterium]